jgi:hypothetical protein
MSSLQPYALLLRLDAPEVRSKDPAEKAKGMESQAFVNQWFTKPGEVLKGLCRRR